MHPGIYYPFIDEGGVILSERSESKNPFTSPLRE